MLASTQRHYGRRRRGRGDSVLASAARWLLLFFGTLYVAWAVFWPSTSGAFGIWLHDGLVSLLGSGAVLIVPILFCGLLLYFQTRKGSGLWTWALGSLLCLFSACTLLAALGLWFGRTDAGGTAGALSYGMLRRTVGAAGAWILSLCASLLGARVLLGISLRELAERFAAYLIEDYRSWLRARGELQALIRGLSPGRTPAVALAGGAPAPSAAPAAPPQAEPHQGPPSRSADAASCAPQSKRPEPARRRAQETGTPAGGEAGFQPPPLGLLRPSSAEGPAGPEESEIRSAAENLNRTFASFDIQAQVSGYSPGPVITRYEVSPAPGVTVSSIVARANDIALAMRARGIRMLAPIPGKAAIGIEIPNQRPAGVTLREILESPALSRHGSPLAFALGLSSDGQPLAADLQALPHLLVAGATNSGKSVMMHALIQSILFRCGPDRVKLILIDPKRIELGLYEGIPHLYDPKTPCENVGVITHCKDAARSLKALLLVMESRYEKFQAYRARDIDAFNREAAKRGEPGEFYIVVVIDELADLMVVARDVVEDSIQRLAQMARAVGIHLVLATQRPSVDVITGVIKANLPARAALRVASKVDSKVILDGNGAEALLGRGDMLYLSPGQEPARVQGAYVSTEEIGRVVEHLRAQGKPDYPLLGSMAAVGEEDLNKFGVEPQEFVQALELVLERRRVSQDLLKSQFGSSARATNLLSLLEVKRFIHKPEGTNRWEISFEQIEDYLRARRPPSAPQ